MSFLRQRLPRFAALVLFAWLLATGVAFAHACQARIDLDCEECCVQMKAPTAWSEARTDAVLPAAGAAPPPLVAQVLQLAWQPIAIAAIPPAEPPDQGGGQRIPIFFLRLAL